MNASNDDASGIWDAESQTWVSDDDVARLRDAVRAMARRRMAASGLAVDHVDGDPTNNDLANLRVVDIRDHRR